MWLQDAGYHTMLCGKYMNGYHANSPDRAAHYIPPGWTEFYGFQTVAFFGTAVNMNGTSYKYPKDNYQTDIIANISLNWFKQIYSDKDKPFFVMLTPHAPHAPYTPAPRHKGKLAGLVQPADPALNLPEALQHVSVHLLQPGPSVARQCKFVLRTAMQISIVLVLHRFCPEI